MINKLKELSEIELQNFLKKYIRDEYRLLNMEKLDSKRDRWVKKDFELIIDWIKVEINDLFTLIPSEILEQYENYDFLYFKQWYFSNAWVLTSYLYWVNTLKDIIESEK